ncbi:MAG: ATP-binding protein [Abditibacteriales bacterium]|nr:ATP-binding protein [Abditibacteriales bacterium]MDW8364888.1 ATP-binding protein [Abditibacteriales bacterium]
MKSNASRKRRTAAAVRQDRLTALLEAGITLSSELSLGAVLQKIVEIARAVIGAQYAALGVVGEDGMLTQFFFTGVDQKTVERIGALPTGKGVLGAIIEQGKPVRLRDIRQHPKFLGFPPYHPPMRSFLGVPIVVRGKVFGRLYLTEKQGADEFTAEDERLALMLATQAGVAVENARLYEDIQQLAASLEDKVKARTAELAERNRQLLQVNEELRRLQELHQAVVESIPSSVLIFDRDLNLVYANPTYFHLWNRQPDIVGKNLRDLFPPETLQREGWEAKMRQVLQSGQPLAERTFRHYVRPRGETIINFDLIRLTGKNPKDDKLLLIMDDVTEQVNLQRQLVQNEKLAAMGLLSAGVAHEIRTPLSVIRLAAYDVREMLSDATQPQHLRHIAHEAQEQLALIERNVLDCNRVIENLLQFAREAKHEPTWLDVNALLKGCLTLAEKDIALQGVKVVERLEEVPLVFAGEDDFKQIFSNLILNAVQAMPAGGTLTLTTTAHDGAVVVSVTDTGHGIPDDVMEHIFDPFFTTKEPGKGTGLGLSICRKIIERMNGSISVQSTVGKGTTFTVRLPVEKEREQVGTSER